MVLSAPEQIAGAACACQLPCLEAWSPGSGSVTLTSPCVTGGD